jgi:hypothetical protein
LIHIKNKSNSSSQKLFILITFFLQSSFLQSAEHKQALRSTKLEKIKKNNRALIPICLCAQTFRKIGVIYMAYTAFAAYIALQEPQQNNLFPWQWLNRSFKYAQQLSIIACALAKFIGAHYVTKWAVEYTCPKIMRKHPLANHAASTNC